MFAAENRHITCVVREAGREVKIGSESIIGCKVDSSEISGREALHFPLLSVSARDYFSDAAKDRNRSDRAETLSR